MGRRRPLAQLLTHLWQLRRSSGLCLSRTELLSYHSLTLAARKEDDDDDRRTGREAAFPVEAGALHGSPGPKGVPQDANSSRPLLCFWFWTLRSVPLLP